MLKWNKGDVLPKPYPHEVLCITRQEYAPDDVVIQFTVDGHQNGRFILCDVGEEVVAWAELPTVEQVLKQLEGE
jgi:hypothetical protein